MNKHSVPLTQTKMHQRLPIHQKCRTSIIEYIIANTSLVAASFQHEGYAALFDNKLTELQNIFITE